MFESPFPFTILTNLVLFLSKSFQTLPKSQQKFYNGGTYMGKKTLPKKTKRHVKQKQLASLTPDKGTFVQRNHKDTLFRFIFRDKRKLLQLYNALSDSNYDNPDDLIITTLENVIFLGYKNDISFLLDWMLYLVEHQGSWNPNMPIRGVLYFARLYRDFINMNGYDLYSSSLIPLPMPQYVVFYNGTAERPEKEILSLSDAFQHKSFLNDDAVNTSASLLMPFPALECKALVININYGKNQELLEKCKPLLEYSYFIHYIRVNQQKGFSIENAVDMAIEQCLNENILTDILRVHSKEVTHMFLEDYEHDMMVHERTVRREGIQQINQLNQKLLQDNRMDDLLRSTRDAAFQEELLKEYGI